MRAVASGDIVQISCCNIGTKKEMRLREPSHSVSLLVVVAELNLLTSGLTVGLGLPPPPPENGNLKFIFELALSLFLSFIADIRGESAYIVTGLGLIMPVVGLSTSSTESWRCVC